MNMNKLLATLNGIENGTVKGTAQKQTSEMKKILESFNKVQVEECGTMPGAMGGMSQREGSPVSMNISLNASGKDNVDELMSLLKSAGLDGSSMPSSMSMPMPAKTMPMALAMDTAEMEEEGFSNSPDEEYSDTEYMTKDLSGGINGQKKMYKPAAKGDNPMAVESIKERLWAALKEKKSKPDFLDMDKDGDKKEPMKKAVADKKGAAPKKGVNPFAKKDDKVKEGWDDMMKAVQDKEKEKGTGKFDSKKTSTGTVYTRKSSTYDDGGTDSDQKKADKKSSVQKKKVSEVFSGFKDLTPDDLAFLDANKDKLPDGWWEQPAFHIAQLKKQGNNLNTTTPGGKAAPSGKSSSGQLPGKSFAPAPGKSFAPAPAPTKQFTKSLGR
jgi:hypothetical protein